MLQNVTAYEVSAAQFALFSQSVVSFASFNPANAFMLVFGDTELSVG